MSTNISEEQTTYNIYIDNKKIDNLLIQNISQNDYNDLVINKQILSNTLYVVSSDVLNMYGEQIKNLASGTNLSDAINLNQLCVAISSVNENIFNLSTAFIPNIHAKKISELCSATDINDQDLLLIVNNNESKNITIEKIYNSIFSSILSNILSGHNKLGNLAFNDYFYISDFVGKIPVCYIDGLSNLAFKNKITSNDISGIIQKNKLEDFDTSNIKFLNGYTDNVDDEVLTSSDTLNIALGKLQKQISTISSSISDILSILTQHK